VDHLDVKVSRARLVSLDQKDILVRLANKDLLVKLAQWVNLVQRENKDLLVKPVLLENRDLLENLVVQE
jgi:hypothetical protein